MYSRSLDPRRVPSALPNHYSGSAFRPDGTPTSIPVKREHDTHKEPPRDPPSLSEVPRSVGLRDSEEEPTHMPPLDIPRENEESPFRDSSSEEPSKSDASTGERPFFSRLFGDLLPGIREDDLLLILLIFLLSREEGNEDVLLILAFLLLTG